MKNQFDINKEIEELIKKKDSSGKTYTQKEIDFIKQHEGKGGQGKYGASGQGVNNQFFTPDYIASIMWKLAIKYGYDNGNVLEPSCGTGRLIEAAPDKSKVTGIELDTNLYRIAQISYPEAKFHNNFFEDCFLEPPLYRRIYNKFTWLEGYPFSLIIGNPPYGKHQNLRSSMFIKPNLQQVEFFFTYYGLKLLKPGGLLIFLTGQNFLRNGISYNHIKEKIFELSDFIDAYRLPDVFRFSQVPTDIYVLKRK